MAKTNNRCERMEERSEGGRAERPRPWVGGEERQLRTRPSCCLASPHSLLLYYIKPIGHLGITLPSTNNFHHAQMWQRTPSLTRSAGPRKTLSCDPDLNTAVSSDQSGNLRRASNFDDAKLSEKAPPAASAEVTLAFKARGGGGRTGRGDREKVLVI